jgi:hypothetical protein
MLVEFGVNIFANQLFLMVSYAVLRMVQRATHDISTFGTN